MTVPTSSNDSKHEDLSSQIQSTQLSNSDTKGKAEQSKPVLDERVQSRFTPEQYKEELEYRKNIPAVLEPYKDNIDQVVANIREQGDIDSTMALTNDLEWTLNAFGYEKRDAELIDKAKQANLHYDQNAVQDAPNYFKDDFERKEVVKALKKVQNPYLMRQITTPQMAHVREPKRIEALSRIDEKLRDVTSMDYPQISSSLGKMANLLVTAPNVFADVMEDMPDGARNMLLSDPEFKAIIINKDYAIQLSKVYQELTNSQKGFFEKVGENISRGSKQVKNNALSLGTDIAEQLYPVKDIASFENDGTPVYKSNDSLSVKLRQDNLDLQFKDAIDPISGDAWYKQGFYGATRMIPLIAGNFAAGPASSLYLYSQGYGELKGNLQDMGYSESTSQSIASIAAAPFAGFGSMQINTVMGNNIISKLLPKLLNTRMGQKFLHNTFIKSASKLAESGVIRKIGSFTLDAGSEIVEEDMQEVVKILSEVYAAQSEEAENLGITAPEWDEVSRRLIDTTVEMAKVAPFITGPAQLTGLADKANATFNAHVDKALSRVLKLDEINEEFRNADMGDNNKTAKLNAIRSSFKMLFKSKEGVHNSAENNAFASSEITSIDSVESTEELEVSNAGAMNQVNLLQQGVPSVNIQAKEFQEYINNQDDGQNVLRRMGVDTEILDEIAKESGGLINVSGDLFMAEVMGTEKFNDLREISYWEDMPLSVEKLEIMRAQIPEIVKNISNDDKRVLSRRKAIKTVSNRIKPVLKERGMTGAAAEANIKIFATILDDIAYSRGESVEDQLEKVSVVVSGKNISGVISTGVTNQDIVNKGRVIGKNVYGEIFTMQDEETIAGFVGRRGRELIKAMVTDGVINEDHTAQYFNSETNELTEAGKNLIEYSLVGSVISDSKLIDNLPKEYKEKLVATSGLIAATGVNENAKLQQMVEIASRHIEAKYSYSEVMGKKHITWDIFKKEGGAFETSNLQDLHNGPYWELAKWLDSNNTQDIKKGLERYYNTISELNTNPVEAFNDMLGLEGVNRVVMPIEVLSQGNIDRNNSELENRLLAESYTPEMITFDNTKGFSDPISQKFVTNPEGKLNWGEIGTDVVNSLNSNAVLKSKGVKVEPIPAPIRINVGHHFVNKDGSLGGFGLIHLRKGRRTDARNIKLISKVLKGYSKVYLSESGRLFLVKDIKGENKSVLVELILKTGRNNDNYYAVISQFSPRFNQLKKMKLVWNRRGNPSNWSPVHTSSSESTGLQTDVETTSDLRAANTNMDDSAPRSLPQTNTNNIPQDLGNSKKNHNSNNDTEVFEQSRISQTSYHKTLAVKAGENTVEYLQSTSTPLEVLDNDVILVGNIQKKRLKELAKLKSEGIFSKLVGFARTTTKQELAESEGLPDYDVALIPRDYDTEKENELSKAGLMIIKYDSGNIDSKIEAFQKVDSIFLANLEGARGQLLINNTQATIFLFTNADPTTLPHEAAHLWFRLIRDGYEAGILTDEKARDFETLKEWLGIGEDNTLTTEQQEMFATGFERYVFENEAPSNAMKSVFLTMKRWLIRVYETVRNLLSQAKLDIEISPEVKAVYDRMLATQKEIDAARNGYGDIDEYSQILRDNEAEFTEKENKAKSNKEKLKRAKEDAEDKAFKITVTEWIKNGGYDSLKNKAVQSAGSKQVYLAIQKLKDKPLGINYVKDSIGDEYQLLIEKHGDIISENGEHPDVAAVNYGYQSGNALLEELMKKPSLKDAVSNETERLYHIQLSEMQKVIHENGVDGTHSEDVAKNLTACHNDMVENSRVIDKGKWFRNTDLMREAAREKVTTFSLRELTLEYARRGEKNAAKKYAKLLNNITKINKRMNKNIVRSRQAISDYITKLEIHQDWNNKFKRKEIEDRIELVQKKIDKRISKVSNTAAERRAQSYIKKLEEVSSKVASNHAFHSLDKINKNLESLRNSGMNDFTRIYRIIENGIEDIAKTEIKNLDKILKKENSNWKSIEEQNLDLESEIARIEELLFDASTERILYNFIYVETKKVIKDTRKFQTIFSKSRLAATIKSVDANWQNPILDIGQTYLYPNSTTKRMMPVESSDTLILSKTEKRSTDEFGGVLQETDINNLIGEPTNYIADWIIKKEKPNGYTGIKDLTVGKALDIQEALAFLIRRGRGDLNALKSAKKENVEDFVNGFVKNVKVMKSKNLYGDGSRLWWGTDSLRKVGAYLKMTEFLCMEADNYQHLDKAKGFGQMMNMFKAFVDADARCGELITETYQKLESHLTQIGHTMSEMSKRGKGDLTHKPGHFKVHGLPVPNRITKYRGDTKWTANSLFAAALNMGNDSNLYALCVGYDFISGIGKDGRPVYDRAKLKRIQQQFSSKDVKAIIGVWKVLDTLFPLLDDAYYRATGQRLVKEKPSPFYWHTSDGEVIYVEGGYYPLKYDGLLDLSVAELDEIASSKSGNTLRFVKTNDGQTKTRLRSDEGKAVVSKPPKLDVSAVLSRHIYETIRDITHKELVMEADSITKHPKFVEEFRRVFGLDAFKTLRDWLGYQANPLRVANTRFDSVVNYLRNANSLSTLGANFTGGVKQRTSIFTGISAMDKTGHSGYKYFLKGVRAIGMSTSGLGVGLKGNSAVQEIFKLSPFMKQRNDIYGFDVYEQKMKLKPLIKHIEILGETITWSDIQNVLMSWIRMNDQAAVMPLFSGCMQQAMDQNLNGIHQAMPLNEQIKLAVKYAEHIVRTTQPSTATTDLAAIQRDKGLIKLFTPFMTFTLKNGNLFSHAYNSMKAGKMSKAKFFAHVIESFYLPRWAMIFAASALPHERKDRKDSFWWDMAVDPVKDMFATVPLVRDFVPSDYYKKSALEVPAVSKLNYLYTSVSNMSKGDYDKAALDFWKLSCWLGGIPWYAGKRSFIQSYEIVTQEEEK